MAKKILLVEDEKSIAEGIIYNLKNEGMRVTHVDEGPIALDLFEESQYLYHVQNPRIHLD